MSHTPRTQRKDHTWRPFLITLLVIEIVYVCVEFGLNAAILNTASYSLGGGGEGYLELLGFKIAGFGVGLLIFGFLMLRRPVAPSGLRQIVTALIVFPVAMMGTFAFNGWLLYTYIPDRTTPEQMYAAQYLPMLAPAVQKGLIEIEDTPLTPESLNRPESKAFITLLGPAMLQDEGTVNLIVRSAPDLIKYQAHEKALERADEVYENYEKASRLFDVDALYREYQKANREYEPQKQALIRKTTQGFNYGVMSKGIQNGLTRYMKQNPKGKPEDYLTGARSSHVKGLSYKNRFDVKPSHFRITGYNPRTGQYKVDSRQFFVAAATAEAEYTFSKMWNERMAEPMNYLSSGDIRPGLSKAGFLASEWAQNHIQRLTGGLAGDRPITLGLSKTELINQHLLPNAWERAERAIGRFSPTPEAAMEKRINRDNMAAIYGPAIALSLSLLLSLLMLGKIAGRIWMIANCTSGRPDTQVSKIKLGIIGGFAVVVLALPMLVTTNTLARSEAIEAAAGDKLNPLVVIAMRWTMDVEPLIYPIGNALLPYLPVGFISGYHDPDAGESVTTGDPSTVQALRLTMPLSVKDLQSRLHQEGLNPGPVDGVIGKGTTEALRNFQRRHNLEPTGTQTLETIKVLREG